MIKEYKLNNSKDIDIEKTFECGQCFRWNKDRNGIYHGIIYDVPAEIRQTDAGVFIKSSNFEIWDNYFDVNTDYYNITKSFSGISEYMDKCIEYGYGIHILNQNKWEALCSFIISQCNNIKRIKGIVERLCEGYGNKIIFNDSVYYTFPEPTLIAELEVNDLDFIRAGYRAQYIIDAAHNVSGGLLNLEKLSTMTSEESLKLLKQCNGIGNKVANCVNLFGLGHTDSFPIDTWMKKALKNHFPDDFNPEIFGNFAGLAQQYIFYYARNNEN